MKPVFKVIYTAALFLWVSGLCSYASPLQEKMDTYIVYQGDTLYSIADFYGISIKELKKLNGLKKNRLKVGQILYVPAQEEEVALKEEKPVQDEKTIKDERPVTEESAAAKVEDGESTSLTDRLLASARELIGVPYRFGGNTLKGIDCSAYVKKVFAMFNVELPRSAREQFHVGNKIKKNDLMPGDVVFFRTYARYPSHVGIFIGDDKFIHASSKDKKVSISSLTEPYYSKRFIGAKRIGSNL